MSERRITAVDGGPVEQPSDAIKPGGSRYLEQMMNLAAARERGLLEGLVRAARTGHVKFGWKKPVRKDLATHAARTRNAPVIFMEENGR